jgi:hypothetical protein
MEIAKRLIVVLSNLEMILTIMRLWAETRL